MAARVSMVGAPPPPSNLPLNTQEGADRAIGDGTKLALPAKIAEIRQARQRLEQSQSPDEQRALMGFVTSRYGALVNIGEYSSVSVLERIPKSEIEALFLEASRVFGRLQFDPRWTMTGILMKHDMALLACLYGFLRVKANVKLFVDLKLISTLASFCASRSGIQMPCEGVAQLISCLIHRTCGCLSQEVGLQFPQIFFLLEGCRMLEQMLRLATVPYERTMITQMHIMLLDALTKCPTIVRQRLVPGTPTGETLSNIMKQPRLDGYVGDKPPNPYIESRLQHLYSMAMVPDKVGELNVQSHICQKCRTSETIEKRLAACSRCKSVFYCSSECQKADWAKHKGVCKPKEEKEAEIESDSAFSRNAVFQLLQSNYYNVMIKIHEMVKTTRKKKKEFLLEVDFRPDESGTAPSLRTPPEFRIVPLVGYTEGINLPSWYEDAPAQEVTDPFIRHVKNVAGILTEDELLIVMRGPAGHTSMFRFAARIPQTKKHIFSTEAFELVGRFRDRRADRAALETVFDEAMITNLHLQRDKDVMTPPDLEDNAQASPNMLSMEELNRIMSEIKTYEETSGKAEEEGNDEFQQGIAYN